jgi:hypothetical protein
MTMAAIHNMSGSRLASGTGDREAHASTVYTPGDGGLLRGLSRLGSRQVGAGGAASDTIPIALDFADRGGARETPRTTDQIPAARPV